MFRLVKTNSDIKDAVMQWCGCSTRAAALKKYGRISGWNTSQVTDCKLLFRKQADFDDRFFRWDV